ncbi:MAG TPA: hypothetical protein VJ728_14585, partial [Candidatus Binataceae bacterium]|nr:hypothetical protein [Candidatus Binataceae bacterium]
QFQAGYLPVTVSVSGYGVSCSGEVRNADLSEGKFAGASETSAPASGNVTSSLSGAVGGLAAVATGNSDQLIPILAVVNTPVEVGKITGLESKLIVEGIGVSTLSYGGYGLTLIGLTADSETFGAFNLPADSHCSEPDPLRLSFSNPNPYAVPLAADARQNVFLATGDQAATNPFGFPGVASTNLVVGNGNVTDISGDGGTSTIFERELDMPQAGGCSASGCRYSNTLEIAYSTNCFADGQDRCDAPPTDTTQSTLGCVLFFSGTDCGLVPPGESTLSLEFPAMQVSVKGQSNIETDASTGAAVLIRTGYGVASGSASIRIYRGDVSIGDAQFNEPAKLRFTGTPSIQVTVSDASGRQIGFQPAPIPTPASPRLLDAQPGLVAEIPGASYSGIPSDPQILVIPDPKPGTYQAVVKAAGDPAFTLVADTLRIDGSVIDSQSVNGTVTAGTSASFTFNIDENGRISTANGGGGGDTVPPTTSSQLSPAANKAGWNNSNVSVTLTAADSAGGSGVKQITYSATGAQAIASTTAGGASASFTISAEGQTVITFSALDNAGNAETPKQLTLMIDHTAPSVTCGAADGQWHATDASIACVATDNLSGLANAADSSLSLTTSGPAGTETANALTGSHSVCDIAGNCATAGPIAGNMVDKKPPTINISSPASGTYLVNQAVTANYSCSDSGSGVATCAGPVPSGSSLSTSSVGSNTFAVNATDKVGNIGAPQSVDYTVAYKVCVLYDPSRSVQSGSTIPLKIQLCDASNNDASSSSVIVHAVSLVQSSTSASELVQSSGSANPDNDFRYDNTLGSTGGYIFNLSTRGLSTGSYALTFTAGADPTMHTLVFQVR